MSSPANPIVPAAPPTAMVATNSVFSKILLALEVATEIMAVVPSPVLPFAGVALSLEQIVGAAISAQAASRGQTVQEVIAQLHQIQPVA